MEQPIRNILMPVPLEEDFLQVIRQVAQLAGDHGAKLHLLFANEKTLNESLFPWAGDRRSFVKRQQAWSLLNLWQYMIEMDFNIGVEIHIPRGSWRKNVLLFAAKTNADIIVLHEKAAPASWLSSYNNHLHYIIRKSPCQVMTLFSGAARKNKWQQAVIPVTNFVPEQRIQTIMKTAVALQLKIHLVSLGSGHASRQDNEFYFMTETLKRLKPLANIQVVCRCLENGYGPVDSFIKYSKSIGADLLMTRMSEADKESEKLKDIHLFSL